jgi:hypothetical protein
MRLDDPTADRETQSDAPAAISRSDAVEFFEDALLITRWYAGSMVRDRDRHGVARPSRRNLDRATWWRVFDRVLQWCDGKALLPGMMWVWMAGW